MALDFYVQINGIDGQSNDKGHSKWIEAIAFSHGSKQQIASERATAVAGRGTFEPFIFVHGVVSVINHPSSILHGFRFFATPEKFPNQGCGGFQHVVIRLKNVLRIMPADGSITPLPQVKGHRAVFEVFGHLLGKAIKVGILMDRKTVVPSDIV